MISKKEEDMEKQSILKSIKKLLQVPDGYVEFDQDIQIHINSVFAILHQLGVGPSEGFGITGETETWDDFEVDGVTTHHVRSYVYLKVRLMFDPPANSFLVSSLERQVEELDFRLTVAAQEAQNGK